MERSVRPTSTLESRELEEALQPLAAALLESAQWWQLNKAEEMTAKDAQKLASAQAARAEELVPFLQGYGDDADNKLQPASEQLADRESALYRDALTASYIQELRAQGIELSDVELVANDVPLSGELPKSEQRRLLLPIEYALRAAEHENRENGTLAPVVGIGRAAVRRGSRREVGVTSSSDKSAWEGAKAAAA
ncbi:hypothetical protein HG437_000590 [Candidatus Saccharibacteria bacterium]|nr:hypothetical protein [Candidatus Saccharibacteria bacterium]